jgi:hypothetical protein
MILSIQNAIPKELIDEVRGQASSWFLENTPPPYNNAYNRLGRTVCITQEPALKAVDDKLSKFLQEFSAAVITPRFTPQFPTGDSGFEYHRYEIGDSCFVHSDGVTDMGANSVRGLVRYATVLIHLNSVAEGGETVFPNQNQSFKTIEGQVLVFPPYGTHPHYVTPSSEPREIVMTWMVYSGINIVRC